MKTITKVALSTMTLVAVAAGSVAGTLAYLQSQTPVATNVMASGGVEIRQLELQRKEGVAHIKEAVIGDLVPFQQNQVFAPAHPVEGASNPYTAEPTDLFEWGPYVTADGAANGLWNDDELEGAIDKFVFVENTGDSACYYRTLIAFECPEDTEYSEGSDKEFMMNVNGNCRFKWSDEQYITVGGTRYLLMVATYTEPLAAKEISRPSLLQVVMTHNATNEDVEKLNGEYEILVMSQACQTGNFADAQTSLDSIFGAADTTNATKWFSDSLGIVTVSTMDDLKQAVENGATYIDAKGADLGDLDEVDFLDGTVIANATFTGDANHGSYGNDAYGTVTFENVTFDSEYAYAAHFDGGNGNLIFRNCSFSGWNSFGTAITSVEMENCTFSNNGHFGLVRFYQDATMSNCNFASGMEGVDVNANVTVKVNDCTYADGSITDMIHNNGSYEGTWIVDGVYLTDVPSW